MTKGKNLKQLSVSQTDKLRAMLAQQRKSGNGQVADISQLGYKEMDLNKLFNDQVEDTNFTSAS